MPIFRVKEYVQLEEMKVLPGMLIELDLVFGGMLEDTGKISFVGMVQDQPIYVLESP